MMLLALLVYLSWRAKEVFMKTYNYARILKALLRSFENTELFWKHFPALILSISWIAQTIQNNSVYRGPISENKNLLIMGQRVGLVFVGLYGNTKIESAKLKLSQESNKSGYEHAWRELQKLSEPIPPE